MHNCMDCGNEERHCTCRHNPIDEGNLEVIRDIWNRRLRDRSPTSAQATSAGHKNSLPTIDVDLHQRADVFADEDTVTYALHTFQERSRTGRRAERRRSERESMRAALRVAFMRNAQPAASAGEPVAYVKEWDNIGDPNDRRKCVDFDSVLGSHMHNTTVTPLYATPVPPGDRGQGKGWREPNDRELAQVVEVFNHHATTGCCETLDDAMKFALATIHAVIAEPASGAEVEK